MSEPQQGPGPVGYGPPTYGQQGYGPPMYGQPGYGQPPYGYVHPAYARPPYSGPGWGAPPVDKHTGWFVVNWIFCWPLAIYSLLSAWQNIDAAAYAGDLATAGHHAARVKKFGIIGLCIGIAFMVLVIVVDVLVFARAVSHLNDCSNNPYGC